MSRDAEDLLARAGQVWQQHLHPALESALHALPEQEAEIIHLAYYHNQSDEATAALLNIPGGAPAVETIRQEALVRLGASLGERAAPEQTASLLAVAGSAWRQETQRPLPEVQREAARRMLTRLTPDDQAEPHPSRPPAPGRSPRRLRARWGRPAAWSAAMLVLALLYGALWGVGQASLPATHTLASVEAYEQDLHMGVRSGEALPRSLPPELAEGVAALLRAPTSTFGLFPRYDARTVANAITALERAYQQADDPFVRARAAFFLAKAHLMRNDPAAARMWLNRGLAEGVALYRQDAQELLRQLDAL